MKQYSSDTSPCSPMNLLTSYELSSEYECLQSGMLNKFNSDINQTAIKEAKTTILKPVNFLLIVMGWRSIQCVSPANRFLNNMAWLFNNVYPIIVFTVLLCASIIKLVSCQHRSVYLKENISNVQECFENLLTFYVAPTIILLVSYLYILYLFRANKSEHVANLMERVYLHYNQKRGNVSKKSIQIRIYFILSVAVILGIVSMILIGTRTVLSVKYLIPTVFDINDSKNISHPASIIIPFVSCLPIFLLDLFYINALLVYLIQSQMIIYYFNAIIQRIRLNELSLKDAIKEIELGHDFLKKLNHNISIAISLNMLNNLISCTIAGFQLNSVTQQNNQLASMVFAYLLLDFLRWVVLLVIPLFQAMLVTNHLKGIRKLGLFLKTRPFGRMDTPEEELNSFQMYSDNIPLTAKLFVIPIYPWMVSILSLITVVAALFWLNIDQQINDFWV